jgi:hypothetical protein
VLFVPTITQVIERGLLTDIETMNLDRGYDNRVVRGYCTEIGIDDLVCARKRKRGTARKKVAVSLGMRWPVERTNSWLSNFGQLRRNTDRFVHQRLAQIDLAVALILTIKPPSGPTDGAHTHDLLARALKGLSRPAVELGGVQRGLRAAHWRDSRLAERMRLAHVGAWLIENRYVTWPLSANTNVLPISSRHRVASQMTFVGS